MVSKIDEAWAALDKPLFDLEWVAASSEDTAEAWSAVLAAIVAFGHAVNEQYADTLAVKVVYENTKDRLDALLRPARGGQKEE